MKNPVFNEVADVVMYLMLLGTGLFQMVVEHNGVIGFILISIGYLIMRVKTNDKAED